MLLGGLWHGASWNFVVWGGLHGTALVIHKFFMDNVSKKYVIKSLVYKLFTWFITLTFVCITWIFFRSTSFSMSLTILKKMFCLSDPVGINWYATSFFLCLPTLILIDFLGNKLNQGFKLKLTTFHGMFLFFFVLFGLIFLGPHNSSPFIYFQFWRLEKNRNRQISSLLCATTLVLPSFSAACTRLEDSVTFGSSFGKILDSILI